MSAMPITQESLPSQEPDAAARLQARQQPISPATVQHAEDNQAQLAQALQDVVEPKPGDTNAGASFRELWVPEATLTGGRLVLVGSRGRTRGGRPRGSRQEGWQQASMAEKVLQRGHDE